MKIFIWAILGLGLCSCKFNETKEPINEEIIYVGLFSTENLEFLSLKTMSPARRYDLKIASQTLTISDSVCAANIHLSDEELSDLLTELSEVRICEIQNNTICNDVGFVTTDIAYYYKNAIDPDYLAVELPRRCVLRRGVCSSDDLTKALTLAKRYGDRLNCLN